MSCGSLPSSRRCAFRASSLRSRSSMRMDSSRSDARDTADLAMAALVAQCLAREPEPGSMLVHTLVSRAMRYRDTEEARRAALHASSLPALEAVLGDDIFDVRLHARLADAIAHARFALAAASADPANMNVPEARLLDALYMYDAYHGNYSSARQIAECLIDYSRTQPRTRPRAHAAFHDAAGTHAGPRGRSRGGAGNPAATAGSEPPHVGRRPSANAHRAERHGAHAVQAGEALAGAIASGARAGGAHARSRGRARGHAHGDEQPRHDAHSPRRACERASSAGARRRTAAQGARSSAPGDAIGVEQPLRHDACARRAPRRARDSGGTARVERRGRRRGPSRTT